MRQRRIDVTALCAALCALTVLIFNADDARGEPSSKTKFTPVLELFTSQGCSSCPPADKYFGTLQERQDLVTLSLPVDYWDYLGWQDTLARPENAARQRVYAKVSGTGSVYTPQVVVNGVTHAVGSRPDAIDEAIETAKAELAARSVPIKIHIDNGNLVIEAEAAKSPAKSATVWLALVSKVEKVKIVRGENRGKAISYYNVVRDIRKVGEWSGEAARILVPKGGLFGEGRDSCAVLIQEGAGGPIIGAAHMRAFGS